MTANQKKSPLFFLLGMFIFFFNSAENMLEITLSFICSLCHSFWYDSKAKSMFLCSLSLYVSCSFLSYPTHLSYYCCFVFSCLFIIGLFEIVKMSREAEERICSASDSEQKAECYEQAFDGRERPFAEASLPFGLREWVYETSNQHCESPLLPESLQCYDWLV